MTFQLTPTMIQSAAQSGAIYAEQFHAIIAAVDEARRPDLLERAIAGLRVSLAAVIADMRQRGASDVDARVFQDAAAFSFSDRITELLSP